MNIGSLIAVYFVVWWIVLFAVLPWGVRTQHEDGEVVMGTEASAPTRPRLLFKAMMTSIVAAVVVFGIWLIVDYFGWSVKEIGEWMAPKL